jgi:phenylpropionate dioxygenase-like ring-hydroxylating dioxygenase large terminal subunit
MKSNIKNTPRDKEKEPVLRGDKITGDRYYSKEFLKNEFDFVWPKVWQIAGWAADISNPNDFFIYKIGQEEILVVRQQDLSIKAFYNVCPHRGNLLVQVDEGSLKKFKCTYHGWEFDAEGVLRYAKDSDDFIGENLCGKITLQEVSCDEALGFVWINYDRKCISLREFIYPALEHLEPYQTKKFIRVLNLTAEIKCNWKMLHDNFSETYHVDTLHPNLMSQMDSYYKDSQFDMYESGVNRMLMPGHRPAKGYKNNDSIEFPLDDVLRLWELDPNEFIGRTSKARVALQKNKRKLSKDRGYWHYEYLTDEQLTDYYHYSFFPNFSLTMTPDGFELLRPQPHPTDPNKCFMDHWYMVPIIDGSLTGSSTFADGNKGVDNKNALEIEQGHLFTETPAGRRPLRSAPHEWINYPEESLGFIIDQDVSIGEAQQKGVKSRGFKHSILLGQEGRVRRYHEILNDYIADKG